MSFFSDLGQGFELQVGLGRWFQGFAMSDFHPLKHFDQVCRPTLSHSVFGV
jgi:hypothetical protein